MNKPRRDIIAHLISAIMLVAILSFTSCSGGGDGRQQGYIAEWEAALASLRQRVESIENRAKTPASLTLEALDEMKAQLNISVENASDKTIALLKSGYPESIVNERMGPDYADVMGSGLKTIELAKSAVIRRLRSEGK